MNISKTLASLIMGAALMNQDNSLIPEKKGSGIRGKEMPVKWWNKRKKRLKMQKESRRKNRA